MKKPVTLDDIAVMLTEGFKEMHRRFDQIHQCFDRIDKIFHNDKENATDEAKNV